MLYLLLLFLPWAGFAAMTPDFDLLQGSRSPAWGKLKQTDLEELQFYKALFLQNYQEEPLPDHPVRIPQVFHYIWLGPRPFPEESVSNVRSWKEKHPGWVFKFWTDRPEREPPISGMEKHLIRDLPLSYLAPFLERTDNYGEKSDMLRYEILFQQGGVYVDHDVVCYQSFSSLNRLYDFYACLEDFHAAEGQRAQIFPCNCLIGAVPGHDILFSALSKVQERWDLVEQRFPENSISRVMHRTFLGFTEAVREQAGNGRFKNFVMPASYVFPDKVYSKREREKWGIARYPMASHHFASLWQENKLPAHFEGFKKSQREQMKKLSRRVTRLSYLCAVSLLLALFLLLRSFRKLS